jgi:3D (Asp-Asp-Asp) domain-containing protein
MAGASLVSLTILTSCTGGVRPPAVPSLTASATAYCQSGTTKSGAPTRPGIIAADPDVLPLGSVVRIDAPQAAHDGIYEVLDTGSAVTGRVVDIYMKDCRAARRFGRREVTVYILQRGEPAAATTSTTS